MLGNFIVDGAAVIVDGAAVVVVGGAANSFKVANASDSSKVVGTEEFLMNGNVGDGDCD